MRPFSEREQIIFESLDKTGAITMQAALGLKSGDYNFGNFQIGARIKSVLSDRQLEVINNNRLGAFPALPPLVADLVEVVGARSGQVIDLNNGFIFPGDDFCAEFQRWQDKWPILSMRKNRKNFSKYVLEPRLTLVYPN